ncbi:hypothetical protein B0H13DRAFT_1881769 [Mycena leptocephala]|nr:hypothetical protein B0H13DRAFT_1881769 [Mycena leptocephala]
MSTEMRECAVSVFNSISFSTFISLSTSRSGHARLRFGISVESTGESASGTSQGYSPRGRWGGSRCDCPASATRTREAGTVAGGPVGRRCKRLAANVRLARSRNPSGEGAQKEREELSADEIHAIDTGRTIRGGSCVGEAAERSSDASTIAIRCDQRCEQGVDEELGALAQRGAGVEDGERCKAPGSLRRSRGCGTGGLGTLKHAGQDYGSRGFRGGGDMHQTCDLFLGLGHGNCAAQWLVESVRLVHSETAGIETTVPRMLVVAGMDSSFHTQKVNDAI